MRLLPACCSGPHSWRSGATNCVDVQVGETLRACGSLHVNEEGTRVKRAAKLDPEAAVKGVDERSLYAAPFPFDTTLERLSTFWSSVGPTNGVRLRRHAVSKDFKGSVFVEFSTQEAMQEVNIGPQ